MLQYSHPDINTVHDVQSGFVLPYAQFVFTKNMKTRRLSFTSRRRRSFLLRCVLIFSLLLFLHVTIHSIWPLTSSFFTSWDLGFRKSSFSIPFPRTNPSSDTPHESKPTQDPWSTHPITRLMSLAEDQFRSKLARQSQTLEAAITEYQHRYSMRPPKGFDRWWAFAREHDIVMVDEYDGLMRDLRPFYELRGGGEEVRRRLGAVVGLASVDLVRVRDGVVSTVSSVQADGYVDTEVSARAKGLGSMLGRFAKDLPDMDFPVNAKAEGRVVVPWEKMHAQHDISMNNNTNMYHLHASFKPDWKGEGNVWDAWRRTCPPNSTARKLFSSITGSMSSSSLDLDQNPTTTHPILHAYRELNDPNDPFDSYHPFDPTIAHAHVQTPSQSRCTSISKAVLSSLTSSQFTFSPHTSFHDPSFCDHPHLHYTQGHFFSDWRTLGELYPLMSPAKASGFGDIKIPSHYYYGSTASYTYGWDAAKGEISDVDKDEVAWGSEDDHILQDVSNTTTATSGNETPHKLDKIFWRGATTGGGNNPAGFAGSYHRHRAVRSLGGWDRKGAGDIWVPTPKARKHPSPSSSIIPHSVRQVQSLFRRLVIFPFVSILRSPRLLPLLSDRPGWTHDSPSWAWFKILPPPAPDAQKTSLEHGLADGDNLSDSVLDIPLVGEDSVVDVYGGLTHLSIPYSTLNQEIMDVAFMKVTNPKQYPGGLEKLMRDHRFAEGIPLGGHWKYKYLLDLDGMSYSGRFMAFLASDSVPVKSTVYEEYFSDWIEPWLHYIPLSSGYEEIYNIYAYFSGIPIEVVGKVQSHDDSSGLDLNDSTSKPISKLKYIPGAPDGDARLHRIALAGKQWKKTIGRKVDMEAYVYRLALEWARLCSDDREGMTM
ncbi:hypothetical protein C8R42DRAFT_393752 [Lentinula raphanica]|nr:hypothetical protein C8R42DRAFT_393752 [Lentinula raphanica]